ncbi:restriction endonuclease subunit S [[Kitasatospora] papulosa]|uniref:restriction endonuclease subunit S n=1 Tax=[Kitasatospora] papulosa TaxID=1464011 RepID=UPI003633CB2C
MTAFRIKDVARINRHVLPETTDPDFRFRYIDIGSVDGMGNVSVPNEETVFASAPSRARRRALPGSVLVSTVRTYLQAIAVAPEHEEPLVYSTGFAVLDAQPGVESRFLGYHCRSQPFIDEVVARSTGVSYPAINASEIGNLSISLPSQEDQRRISDFLDAETARINQIMRAATEGRRLLDARRWATVHALSTGADQVGEHRDPGLGWAQKIPTTWPVVPLKFVADLGSGHTPSRSRPEYWQDCTIPWISLFDVGRMRNVRQTELSTTAQSISTLGMANSSACLHPAGTVVLSRTASVGFSTVMGVDMAVSQHFVTWTCGERLAPSYLLLLLRSMKQYFESVQVGTTNVTVFMPDLYSIKVPLPPIHEQHDIVDRITLQTNTIDALAERFDRQISLLKERRQALITAAVAGQFDVSAASGRNVTDGVHP